MAEARNADYWRNRKRWAMFFAAKTDDKRVADRLLAIAREAARFEREVRGRTA